MRWLYGGLSMSRRVPLWIATVLAILLVAFALSGFVVDRPLRGIMERKLNAALEGYTARVGRADFHPFGFGIDLEEVVLRQDALPEPPVLRIHELKASVQWKQLLRARLVADFEMNDPVIWADRRHAEAEDQDAVPVQERGWQDALQAIYPLKINEFRANRAKITYLDQEQTRPLEIADLHIVARNIRNRPSQDRKYPSDMSAEARVFERGRMTISGQADFLAKPHAGVNGTLALSDVQLDYFAPVLARANLDVRAGVLGLRGNAEFSPTVHRFALEELLLSDIDADLVHSAQTSAREEHQAKQVASAARELTESPETEIYAKRLLVENARIGWVNRATDPDYRVFVKDLRVEVENFSNQFTKGPADMRVRGWFMGGGALAGIAQFRPEKDGPDFDVDLRVVDTPLTALNDLLRAHGHFDVVGGKVSVYSEVSVKNGQIRGYVKPLFRDIDVYSGEQDKGILEKLYEAVIGGFGKLLENDPRGEIATVVDVSGPLEDPKTSTWRVVVNLLKNAFVDAILPGFERQGVSKKVGK